MMEWITSIFKRKKQQTPQQTPQQDKVVNTNIYSQQQQLFPSQSVYTPPIQPNTQQQVAAQVTTQSLAQNDTTIDSRNSQQQLYYTNVSIDQSHAQSLSAISSTIDDLNSNLFFSNDLMYTTPPQQPIIVDTSMPSSIPSSMPSILHSPISLAQSQHQQTYSVQQNSSFNTYNPDDTFNNLQH